MGCDHCCCSTWDVTTGVTGRLQGQPRRGPHSGRIHVPCACEGATSACLVFSPLAESAAWHVHTSAGVRRPLASLQYAPIHLRPLHAFLAYLHLLAPIRLDPCCLSCIFVSTRIRLACASFAPRNGLDESLPPVQDVTMGDLSGMLKMEVSDLA